MIFLLPSLILSIVHEDFQSLVLDDTYHEVQIDNTTNVTYLVQPVPSHAAVILIHGPNCGTIHAYQSQLSPENFHLMSPKNTDRENSYVESRYSFSQENPLFFRLSCDSVCSFSLNYVHTDPVYRVSAVLGSFALFVCLFLLVFSWTIFCGACRATRKR